MTFLVKHHTIITQILLITSFNFTNREYYIEQTKNKLVMCKEFIFDVLWAFSCQLSKR